MAGESTHIGRKGPAGKRRRRTAPAGPRPVRRRQMVGVGRYSDRFFDPVTGRRRAEA